MMGLTTACKCHGPAQHKTMRIPSDVIQAKKQSKCNKLNMHVGQSKSTGTEMQSSLHSQDEENDTLLLSLHLAHTCKVPARAASTGIQNFNLLIKEAANAASLKTQSPMPPN